MADDDVLAKGLVDLYTTVRIHRNGTFTMKTGAFGLGTWTPPDRLIGFEHDADSMRRKSVSGRGAAALMTGGLSLGASNNRGVLYTTLTGENTGIKTFTVRNPDGYILTDVRTLKAAADQVLARQEAAPLEDVAERLQKLADLHASGALTAAEFAAAKARLLG